MSRRHHVEQYQDRLARLYPEEAIPTKDGQKSLTRTVTFQVTDACNLACTYCVSPDTMILLSDMTYKPIKDIRLEDELIAFDENTGIFDSHTKVEQIYNREVDELYEITFDDTHMLKITGNHKVFRMNGNTNEWIEAKDLNVGDFIYYFDVKVPYSGHFTRKITHINKLTGTFEVFNLGTSTKTYFANGLAVHNCYQINKDKHSMPFEVAKKFFDMLVEADSESCDYINPDKRIRNRTLRRTALSRKMREDNLAEELRVLYVALTRAKEQLYIFTFGPNMTSVFSGEVLKTPKERQILPEKAQKNIHKNVQKKVQQLSAQEVEKCIEACVTGCKVQHRKYGTGEIISGDGRIAEILFLGENTPRKMSLPIAFSAQILTLK